MNLDKVCNRLCKHLSEAGFIIHRYKSFSTNSIYLKLDYGACNSIRISDHQGYEHLSYKYYVLDNCEKTGWKKSKEGFWQYYCSTTKSDISKLIDIIISDRIYKKTLYNYDKRIEDYKSKINYNLSFWRECEEVLYD